MRKGRIGVREVVALALGLALAVAIGAGPEAAAKSSAKAKTAAKARSAAKAKAAAKGTKATAAEVKAGEKLFLARFPTQCRSCHRYNGQGGKIGPDLDHAGRAMDAARIKAFMQNPRKFKPNTLMPPVRASDRELTGIAAFLATKK